MATRKRIAVLISGRGTNMASLIAAAGDPAYPCEIALVVSSRPAAPGLDVARTAGIATAAFDHKAYVAREAFDAAVDAALDEARVDLVALAGYMRIMSDGFVTRWQGRMLNIHPSLLPLFKGLHPQAQALAAGVRISGCTVHVVTSELDSGPIIAQAAVPVLEGDTPGTLAERILVAEHKLYPHALALFATGRARLDGDRIVMSGPQAAPAATILSPG